MKVQKSKLLTALKGQNPLWFSSESVPQEPVLQWTKSNGCVSLFKAGETRLGVGVPTDWD